MPMVVGPEPGAELPERWSTEAKMKQALRLLRGEVVDAVSREIQVPDGVHVPFVWRGV